MYLGLSCGQSCRSGHILTCTESFVGVHEYKTLICEQLALDRQGTLVLDTHALPKRVRGWQQELHWQGSRLSSLLFWHLAIMFFPLTSNMYCLVIHYQGMQQLVGLDDLDVFLVFFPPQVHQPHLD